MSERLSALLRRLKPSVPASPSPVWGKAGMGADAPTTKAVGSGISFSASWRRKAGMGADAPTTKAVGSEVEYLNQRL